MSHTKEAHGHSHSHGRTHHSQSPVFMAEQLLELRNSDPELFNQAWKKIPPSTQENILAYLKKHGTEGQVSSHQGFEDKTTHTGKHRSLPEPPNEPRTGLSDRDIKETVPLPAAGDPRRAAAILGRPLYEWTDGELLAHTFIEAEARESPLPGQGKGDDDLQAELRRISKQSMVQIVQNELIRRLLQTIAGKP